MKQIILCCTVGLAGAAVSPARLSAQSRTGPAAGILGTWHGTSICVDRARDTACHDEEVIYTVDSAAGPTGPVRMVADKVVNGSRESMGELRLRYDTTTGAWSAELQGRFHMRWSFEPKGDAMSGTLVELPSGRRIRRVDARRTAND
ncbi:MAG TPA: hypothetical protein VJ816_09215 [Gemmatimonadales bacterium]|nr:hypothetical protein [Gemmatimonadales bacterium]